MCRILSAIVLVVVTSGCLETSESSTNPEIAISPRPSLSWPETWSGVSDDGTIVILMTPEEHQRLKKEIAAAKIWMRQAAIELGVEPTAEHQLQ